MLPIASGSRLYDGPPPPPTGDYNGDGYVNLDDYGVWLQDFGSTVLLNTDGNNDGLVNAADYTVWRDDYKIALSVPEPSSVLVVISCLFVVVATRLTVQSNRQRRHRKKTNQ